MPAQYFVDDNSPIKIEFAAGKPAGSLHEAGLSDEIAKKVAQVSDDALFNAFKTMYKIARKTEMLMSDLQSDDSAHPLKTAEVEFGLKFTASGEAFISASVEGSIVVKLTWERKA